jgi:hypothetical protein
MKSEPRVGNCNAINSYFRRYETVYSVHEPILSNTDLKRLSLATEIGTYGEAELQNHSLWSLDGDQLHVPVS